MPRPGAYWGVQPVRHYTLPPNERTPLRRDTHPERRPSVGTIDYSLSCYQAPPLRLGAVNRSQGRSRLIPRIDASRQDRALLQPAVVGRGVHECAPAVRVQRARSAIRLTECRAGQSRSIEDVGLLFHIRAGPRVIHDFIGFRSAGSGDTAETHSAQADRQSRRYSLHPCIHNESLPISVRTNRAYLESVSLST